MLVLTLRAQSQPKPICLTGAWAFSVAASAPWKTWLSPQHWEMIR